MQQSIEMHVEGNHLKSIDKKKKKNNIIFRNAKLDGVQIFTQPNMKTWT